jgi:hypothetical protein
VAPETVRHVLVGKSWTHVPDPDGPVVMSAGLDSMDVATAKLEWEDLANIRRLHAKGELSYRQIANVHGVSKETVQDLVKRRTWRDQDARSLPYGSLVSALPSTV